MTVPRAYLAAIADMVERGDPDRFAIARLAGENAWKLHTLYAFNLEIARIPAAVSEPLLAQIRLQWWRDVVAEAYERAPARAHDVAAPLHALIGEGRLPRDAFEAYFDARALDGEGMRLDGPAGLAAYLRGSSGGLMALAAAALGADAEGQAAAFDVGAATGLGQMIRALPALQAQGAQPVGGLDGAAFGKGETPPELREALRTQAEAALKSLAAARARRRAVAPEALPALLANWAAEPALHAAAKPDFDLFGDWAAESEFRKRFRLLSRAMTGRF